MKTLRDLMGSGDRIMLLALPFLVVGLALNVANPALFSVGGPPSWLWLVAVVMLLAGLVVWAWSVALILTNVPRHRLITSGPYRWVRHPLYTAVALLVLPPLGILLNSWLGVVLGAVVYAGSRLFAPAEETALAREFGPAWSAYARRVRLTWL